MHGYKLLSTSLLLLASFVVDANEEVCLDEVLVDTFPFQTTRDISNATVNFPIPTDIFRNLTCGIGPDSPGVWYSIQSPVGGAFFQARIRGDAKYKVALFEKKALKDCTTLNKLECMLPREYLLENERSLPTLTWFATNSYDFSFNGYHLHVAALDENETGAFTLEIEEVILPVARPGNDQCGDINKPTLELDTPVRVNSMAAHPHGKVLEGCSLHAYSRGTFYQIQGTGEPLSIHYRPISEGMRMELAIFPDHNCDFCVASSDFLTSEHSLRLDTVKNLTYVVLVSGERFSDAGEYEVEVTKFKDASSDASNTGRGLRIGLLLGLGMLALLL